MADIAERLFDAVNILIGKKLESVKFDETIGATVTDTSNADQGEYVVSTGNASFKAYSTETRYHINDAVLVTIPQGNYDNQKMIIGKQVDDMNTPIIYTSPFETLIDVTGNLITNNLSWSYWANDPDNFVLEEKETEYQLGAGNSFIEIGNAWTQSKQAIFYKGYSLIGIQAQFSTWLSEYDIARGDYGLLVEIAFKDEFSDQVFRHYLTLDSSEFFGDIYNFETYYTQEQVFDISEYVEYPIVGIKISPYHRNNFITIDGAALPAPEKGLTPTNPNIFIKDVYCCLGTPASGFKTDTAELITDSSMTYYKERNKTTDEIQNNSADAEANVTVIGEKNIKTVTYTDYKFPAGTYSVGASVATKKSKIRDYFTDNIPGFDELISAEESEADKWTVSYTCRWRENDNAKNILLRWVHKDPKTGIIKPVEEGSFPDGYQVQWYKFKLGAKSPDSFAGAHWVRYYGCNAVADPNTGDWYLTQDEYDSLPNEQKEAADLTTNTLLVNFQPNVNLEYERLKAIIFKKETSISSGQNVEILRLIAISNIIEFTNDTRVRNQTTIIDANALSLRFEDDEKGHYFLYDEGGDVGVNEDTEIRKIIAVFDESENGPQNINDKAPLNVEECSYIRWTFPQPGNNTMIVPMTSAKADAQPSQHYIFDNTDQNASNYYYSNEIGFTIKNHLNHTATDNTIRLDIVKDSATYSASVQLVFGTAGTNGSDYTVILQWRHGKNAVNLSSGFGHKLKGDIAIYDQAGNIQAWPNDSQVECKWLVAASPTDVNTPPDGPTVIEKETNNLYYPVFVPIDNSQEHAKVTNEDLQSIPGVSESYYYVDTGGANSYTYALYDVEQKKFIHKNSSIEYRAVYTEIKAATQSSPAEYAYLKYMKTLDSEINSDKVYYRYDGSTMILVEQPNLNNLRNYYERVDIIYRLATNEDERKYKLRFEQVDVEPPKVNESTGKFESDSGDAIRLEDKEDTSQDGGDQNQEQEKVTKYYYSSKQRYFVKYDNIFILDPWDTYQEAETYYIPKFVQATEYGQTDALLDFSVTQAFRGTAGGENLDNSLLNNEEDSDDDRNNSLPFVTIFPNDDLEQDNRLGLLMNSVYILQITVKNFGDFPLVTYYPIPMKNGETKSGNQQTFVVDYIEGPDRVRYGSSGETDYNKNPYKIVARKFIDGSFKTIRHGYREDYALEDQSNILNGFWRIIVKSNTNLQNLTDDNFSPELVETVSFGQETDPYRNITGTSRPANAFNIPVLRPVGAYIPGALPYAVQFCKINEDTGVMEILWTQPILVYENKYPSRTLNKWNGKDILTDEGAGTITASGFSAGKKEDDNSFTGVIIGDWSRSKIDACISQNTGLYGFNHGAMSYAFKDDGTGFIGKDGKGRIMFNGNSSQIYSSNWKGNDNLGMLLDLDDGVIRLHSKVKRDDLLTEYAINDKNILKTFFNILNHLYTSDRELGPDPYGNSQLYTLQAHRDEIISQDDTHGTDGLKVYIEDEPRTTYYYIITIVNYSDCPKIYSTVTHQHTYFQAIDYNSNNITLQEITQEEWDNYDNDNYEWQGEKIIYQVIDLDKIKEMYTFLFTPQGSDTPCRYFNILYYYDTSGNNTGTWRLLTKQTNESWVYNENTLYRFNNAVAPSAPESFHYITLSAAESVYPLAIGDVFPSGKRSFRVRWDGKTYITDGDFTGTINARGGNITGTLKVSGTLDGGIITGSKINGSIISGSTVIANYLQADTGSIAGWKMSATGFECGQTRLDANEGITTNLLTIKDNLKATGQNLHVSGSFGALTGSDGSNTTSLLGIRVYTADSTVIEVPKYTKSGNTFSGGNIRLSGLSTQPQDSGDNSGGNSNEGGSGNDSGDDDSPTGGDVPDDPIGEFDSNYSDGNNESGGGQQESGSNNASPPPLCNSIYLYGRRIDFGHDNGTGKGTPFAIVYKALIDPDTQQPTDTYGWHLECNIPSENQSGIYAVFA